MECKEVIIEQDSDIVDQNLEPFPIVSQGFGETCDLAAQREVRGPHLDPTGPVELLIEGLQFGLAPGHRPSPPHTDLSSATHRDHHATPRSPG